MAAPADLHSLAMGKRAGSLLTLNLSAFVLIQQKLIYLSPVPNHVHPQRVKIRGFGCVSVQTYLLSDSPVQSVAKISIIMPPTNPWGKKPPQRITPSSGIPEFKSNKSSDVTPQIQLPKSQYEEIQEDELIALAAIYGEDFRKIDSNHGAWKVCN